MTREAKEERDTRKAREETERLAAIDVYRANLYIRLMAAQSLAKEIGITTEIQLTPSGPSVRFYEENGILDDTVCFTTEEWELECLERRLREKKEEKDARAVRRALAEDVWAQKLNETERIALKENIHYLR
jgi:hypothetical protein